MTPTPISPTESFTQGFLGGYNTMDLIAAFVFAMLVLPHFERETSLEKGIEKQKLILKKMLFSSLIAAALLFLTYTGLAWVASYHAWTFAPSFPPEEMLGRRWRWRNGPACPP